MEKVIRFILDFMWFIALAIILHSGAKLFIKEGLGVKITKEIEKINRSVDDKIMELKNKEIRDVL